ncbi:MAG TPA: class I SAM-dependent methyltransferase [Candidatus Pacearchaeota archaeon]|nr:class I SAM-dependent methyltransferase [Candidatus Pacearchaeota archaeon]
MNQQEVWNKIADEWRDFRIKPISEVKDFLKDKKGKVLDLGCGSGRNLVEDKNLEFYGIDFSKQMVKIAKEKPYKKVLESNAWEIKFPDNFFDYALYISALHCIPSEKNREKSLIELSRVLKPKAKAFISVWDKEQPKFKDKEEEIYLKWGFHDGEKESYVKRYYKLYTKEEIITLLKKYFRIIKIFDKKISKNDKSASRFSRRNLNIIVEVKK